MRTLLFNRARAATLCATTVIAIAGCGGGDDESTDAGASGASGATGASGAPLSEEEFVSQANAICADLNSQIESLSPPSNDLQSLAEFAQQGVDIVQPALESFRALTPPADLQSKWDAFLDQGEQQIGLTEDLQAAAEAGDAQEVQSIGNQINALNNDQTAKELGLDECAKDAQPQG